MNLTSLLQNVRQLKLTVKHQVDSSFAGNYRSTFHGRGLEYEDVREYAPGDDVRDIHWLLTAREGRPFIKTYREERELKAFLVVNTGPSFHFGSEEKTKKETALELSAHLAFSVLKGGDRLGLFSVGADDNSAVVHDPIIMPQSQQEIPLDKKGGVGDLKNNQTFLPAKKGEGHLLNILQTLIQKYENLELGEVDMLPLLQKYIRMNTKRTLLFLISDSFPEKIHKILKILHIKHDLVLFRVQDPFEQNPILEASLPFFSPETGISLEGFFGGKIFEKKTKEYFLEKENIFQKFVQQNGIDLVDISTHDNIAKKLFTFFKSRQMRH